MVKRISKRQRGGDENPAATPADTPADTTPADTTPADTTATTPAPADTPDKKSWISMPTMPKFWGGKKAKRTKKSKKSKRAKKSKTQK